MVTAPRAARAEERPDEELARLRAELARADARRDAVDEAARAIAQLLDVPAVLQLIVDRVRDLVGAHYAALGIVDEYGFIEQFITSGMSRNQRERIGALPVGHGLLGLIIREGRAYRIAEIAAHPASSGFPPNHPPMTSFLGVPVVVQGRPIGNFYLTDKSGAAEFSPDDQRVVELFALHAAIAIENARLHSEVRRLAVVDERERISRDLHDGVIQSLYAISLSLEDVADLAADAPDEAEARIDHAIDSIHATIRDLRNFIFGLRPELLDQTSLVDSLALLAEELRVNAVVEVDTVLEGESTDGLGVDVQAELLKIAREAISNVARHSHATTASVELRTDDGDAVLTVSDNGRGFDTGADPGGTHHGLRNVRRRIEKIGGTVEVESSPGRGTRIIARVPRGEGPPRSEEGT